MDEADLQLVVDVTSLAPSVHNTQPWHFSTDDSALTVRADRSRQLPVLDPDGRQLHISCGAAIEFARLAVRSLDRACTVDMLPDPSDPDVLAVLRVGDPEPATDEERKLIEAMPRRYTDRRPYSGEPVPHDVVERFRRAAEAVGTWLKLIEDSGDRVALAAILEDAESAEARNPGYAEELAQWTHDDPGKEGLSRAAVAYEWPEDVVSDLPLRDFTGHARHPHPGPEEPRRVERDTLVLIGTARDDAAAWVNAGRAIAAVLLHATAAGVSAQPLGPATDFPESRARVRRELRLVGHPQFALRLGYGHDQPRTGRRPAMESLTSP